MTFEILVEDLLSKTIQYLEYQDIIIKCRIVNKYWNTITHKSTSWNNIIVRYKGPVYRIYEYQMARKSNTIKQFLSIPLEKALEICDIKPVINITEFVKRLPLIHHLIISGIEIKHEELSYIILQCNYVTHLSFEMVSFQVCLFNFKQLNHRLKSFVFRNQYHYDTNVERQYLDCFFGKPVNIWGMSTIEFDSFQHFVHLETLAIPLSNEFQPESITLLKKYCPQLIRLELYHLLETKEYRGFSLEHFIELGTLTQLKCLCVYLCMQNLPIDSINGKMFAQLLFLTNLEELVLHVGLSAFKHRFIRTDYPGIAKYVDNSMSEKEAKELLSIYKFPYLKKLSIQGALLSVILELLDPNIYFPNVTHINIEPLINIQWFKSMQHLKYFGIYTFSNTTDIVFDTKQISQLLRDHCTLSKSKDNNITNHWKYEFKSNKSRNSFLNTLECSDKFIIDE